MAELVWIEPERKACEMDDENEMNTESNAESEMETDPGGSGKGMLIPLKVAYLIYVLPIMVLIGIFFLLNVRYGIASNTTILCITFPLILSILLISVISIIQYWRSSRN